MGNFHSIIHQLNNNFLSIMNNFDYHHIANNFQVHIIYHKYFLNY